MVKKNLLLFDKQYFAQKKKKLKARLELLNFDLFAKDQKNLGGAVSKQTDAPVKS